MDEELLGPIAEVTDPGAGGSLQEETPTPAPLQGGASQTSLPISTSGGGQQPGGGMYATPTPFLTPAQPVPMVTSQPVWPTVQPLPLLGGTPIAAAQATTSPTQGKLGVASVPVKPEAAQVAHLVQPPLPQQQPQQVEVVPEKPQSAQLEAAQEEAAQPEQQEHEQPIPDEGPFQSPIAGHVASMPDELAQQSHAMGWEPQLAAMAGHPSYASPEGGGMTVGGSPGKPMYEGNVSENVNSPMPSPEEQQSMQVGGHPGTVPKPPPGTPFSFAPEPYTPSLQAAALPTNAQAFQMMLPTSTNQAFAQEMAGNRDAAQQATDFLSNPLKTLYADKDSLLRDIQGSYDKLQAAKKTIAENMRKKYQQEFDKEWNTPIPGLRIPVYKTQERISPSGWATQVPTGEVAIDPNTGQPFEHFATRNEYRGHLLAEINRLRQHADAGPKIDRLVQRYGALAKRTADYYQNLGQAQRSMIPHGPFGWFTAPGAKAGINMMAGINDANAARTYTEPKERPTVVKNTVSGSGFTLEQMHLEQDVNQQNNPQIYEKAVHDVLSAETQQADAKQAELNRIQEEWNKSQTGIATRAKDILDTTNKMDTDFWAMAREKYHTAISTNTAAAFMLEHMTANAIQQEHNKMLGKTEERLSKAEERAATKEADNFEIQTAKLKEERNWHQAELNRDLPLNTLKLATGFLKMKRDNDLSDTQALGMYNTMLSTQYGGQPVDMETFKKIMGAAEHPEVPQPAPTPAPSPPKENSKVVEQHKEPVAKKPQTVASK